MKIVARAPLGGLGPLEGSPVVFEWSSRALWVVGIPWFVLLGFLALPGNRRFEVGYVFVLLGSLWVVLGGLGGMPFLPLTANMEVIVAMIRALAFGVAALWLAAPAVAGKPRLVAAATMFAAAAGASVLAAGADTCFETDGQTFALWVALCLASGILCSALRAASFWCRKSGGWRRFPAYLVLCVCAGCAAVLGVFCFVLGGPSLTQFLTVYSIYLGVLLAAFLPFLLLSVASPSHGSRLRSLCGVAPERPIQSGGPS